MSNYRRLISYIYAYEGGVKGKNIGFVKIESRGAQCKISVNVKKVYIGSNDMGVYLLSGEKEIFIGNIFVRNGNGEFRTMVAFQDVEHSGCSMDQCYGLTVHDVESTWRSYTTIWEDAVAHAAEIELENVTSENRIAQEKDSGSKGSEITKLEEHIQSIAEEINEEVERAEALKEEVISHVSMEEGEGNLSGEVQEESIPLTESENSVNNESIDGNSSDQENSDVQGEDVHSSLEPIKEAISWEDRRKQEGQLQNGPSIEPVGENVHISPGDTGETRQNRATSPIRINEPEPHAPVVGNPQDLERLQQKEQEELEEGSHQKVWEQLKREHTKIQAFDYEKGCEILTIKPQDIGLMARENWVYGNNSFLLHGYYNYRYLILAKLNNPDGVPRYLLGVPGHYYSNEKYMASMFGLPNFVLAKKQSAEDGRFGYWYTDIKLGS